MVFRKQTDRLEPVTEPPCAQLRSKAIYVTGNLHNPSHNDEDGSHYCWCNLTQHIKGPDDQYVSRRECIAGRACFRSST